ncbi:sensor histidine kinase [Aquincola sp. MAHUQ-54]|uniref:histidine kinase n=1 Tax=Aquincola agrisoli TaxID=3119538 RepID=A0AAW9QHJ8_9BURK
MLEAGLAARLILLGVLSALLIATTGGLLLRRQLHEVVLRSFEQGLAERVERVAAELQAAAVDGMPLDGAATAGEFGRIFSGWYWQLDDGGEPLRSRSLWDSGLDLAAAPPAAAGELRRTAGPRQEPLAGTSRPLALAGRPATLHVFGPVADTDVEMARIDRVLLGLQGAFIAVFTLLTVAQTRIGLAPMRRLQAALSRVRGGQAPRVEGRFGPDLEPLAEEINQVLDRNAQIVERARHHAGNLSHALKKPLALLGAEARKPAVAGTLVQSQVHAMTVLIDRHLARSASGAGNLRWIGVDGTLQSLVALMRQLHAGKALQWQVEAQTGLRWKGESTDLEEMAGNLLDNAGKWAARRVLLRAHGTAQGITLQVEDDGPGLAGEALVQALQRGRRFDEKVEGSGLGLAIVGDIAETYGGSLVLDRSPLGGLRCTLRLG